jgi:hypothetical protein
MSSFSQVFQNVINTSDKRQKPNWFAFCFVVVFTFVLFNQPHDGKLQVLSNIPYFFEGACSLLVAYIGIMFVSKGDISLRERKARNVKVAATALEKSTPLVDIPEVITSTIQKVLIIFETKNAVNFKSIIITSFKATSKLHTKLGGIIHACLTPRLTHAPTSRLA